MHNFKYLVSCAALMLATSTFAGGPELPPANNQGFYLNANGGINFLAASDPYDTVGWNAGGAVGYRFNQFRVEVAGSYLTNDSSNQFRRQFLPVAFGGGFVSFTRLNLADALLNGYYDFDTSTNFIPYLGAGIGWMHTSGNATIVGNLLNPLNNNTWYSETNNMAFQGILGLDYQINDHFRFGVSYHALGWTRSANALPGVSTGLLNGTVQNNTTRFENLFNLGVSYFF